MTNRERINAIVETFSSISIELTQGNADVDVIRGLVRNLPDTNQIQELASWAEYGLVGDNIIQILDESALLAHDASNESSERFMETVQMIHRLWYSR